jgi:hypothetical protein
MDVLSHLFAALGRVLLWISSVLVIEELMLGGLARIFLTMPYDSRGRRNRRCRRRRTTRDSAVPGQKDVGSR